jgi:hypothetical protein
MALSSWYVLYDLVGMKVAHDELLRSSQLPPSQRGGCTGANKADRDSQGDRETLVLEAVAMYRKYRKKVN